jgi:adenylate kinase
MNLIFFGIQGSGKGTQAKLLAESNNYTIFETGGRLRELSKEDSELGRKVKETIDAGHLVSAELVIEILKDFISNHKEQQIIFDGIPRSLEQQAMFQDALSEFNLDATAVHFVVAEDVVMQRLLKRAEIEGRADDNEEAIQRRIGIFKSETYPILDIYKQQNKYIEVDATPDIDQVHQNLLQGLQNYGN